jgi:hypothetical protein
MEPTVLKHVITALSFHIDRDCLFYDLYSANFMKLKFSKITVFIYCILASCYIRYNIYFTKEKNIMNYLHAFENISY